MSTISALNFSGSSYNLNTLSLKNSKDFSSQMANAIVFAFSKEGHKIYVCNGSVIYQYSLSTLFDISTATYDSKSMTVSGHIPIVRGLQISDTGSTFYIAGLSGANSVIYQIKKTVNHDISSSNDSVNSFSIEPQIAGYSVTGLFVAPNGLDFFVSSSNIPGTIFKYLSGYPFDIAVSGFSYVNSFTLGSAIDGFDFSPDGKYLFHTTSAFNKLTKSTLSTLWDHTTATFTNDKNLSSGLSYEVAIKSNGDYAYFTSSFNPSIIYAYTMY